ncbi:MAG: nucleoside-diphosphate kinase [bacterium]
MEQSLLVIKPDAVRRNCIGEILKMVEKAGLKISGLSMLQLDRAEAEEFYSIHRGQDFFTGLMDFITSGPVVAVRVEGENARRRLRELAGATNPEKAKRGTIRHQFGTSTMMNAVHAANPDEDVDKEINFFFGNLERG